MPFIVALGDQRQFTPARRPFDRSEGHAAYARDGSNDVVPIGKDVGRQRDVFADDPLDGEVTAVDERLESLDDDARPAVADGSGPVSASARRHVIIYYSECGSGKPSRHAA